MEKVNVLKAKIERLRRKKTALLAQSRLLQDFVSLAKSSAKEQMLTSILMKTLDLTAELTKAETGSLFLLDPDGVVGDCILTRGPRQAKECLELTGTVLKEGLAGWVMRNRRIGLIADTETDDRWINLPDQPYSVRSAMAVPIIRGDELLGILTLLHSQPGIFHQGTVEVMEVTAGQLGVALESAKLYSKLDAYSRALDAELDKGRQIQKDFLPRELPRLPGWDIAACFLPARQVSGDFYDGFMLPNGCLAIVIGDVCDKGVGSALFMALIRSLLRVFTGKISLSGVSISSGDPGAAPEVDLEVGTALGAVASTNEYIAFEHGDQGMFATLCLGVINPQSGLMAYVNAGHLPLVVIGKSGVRTFLNATGASVGIDSLSRYRSAIARIEPGEVVLGYTDGVTEAMSPDEFLYTKERFFSLLQRPAISATELIDRIKSDLYKHIRHAPQSDDITMIAVYRQG
ncbi:MAG TPA: GAF domain-containing SpoIIE family protein phosphatase [Desulfobacterales bacterium]|nr:GAF domain-containing SpoIIE family protein phosphatase [Desulfobacterales bacterium]